MPSTSEYNKKYREKNKENILKREKLYREENKEKMNENNTSYRKKNPDYHRAHMLKSCYNITIEDWDNMFAKQAGCCEICGIHQSAIKTTLCVDHCHNTGKVRGLLCIKCNTAIGSLNDDVSILEKAIKYLEK